MEDNEKKKDPSGLYFDSMLVSEFDIIPAKEWRKGYIEMQRKYLTEVNEALDDPINKMDIIYPATDEEGKLIMGKTESRSETITLPYPPTVNTIWRHRVIRGRAMVYMSKRGVEYRKEVADVIDELYGNDLLFGTARLSVSVRVYPPDKRRRDIDNICKGLFDSLAHASVFDDDEQIDKLSLSRCAVEKGGKVVVTITVIGGCDED